MARASWGVLRVRPGADGVPGRLARGRGPGLDRVPGAVLWQRDAVGPRRRPDRPRHGGRRVPLLPDALQRRHLLQRGGGGRRPHPAARAATPPSGAGFGAAFDRLPAIIGYAAIAATVGMVLRYISERSGLIGRLLFGGLGVAWTLGHLPGRAGAGGRGGRPGARHRAQLHPATQYVG